VKKDAITKMAPHESAVMAPGAGATMPRPAMTRWTDEELRELVTLWPTNSASQIAKRLHRQRSAIRRKAERLRQEGLLPHNPEHFDVNPPKRRPRAEIMQ
jgi:predicted ArsR family transcriptional regulator